MVLYERTTVRGRYTGIKWKAIHDGSHVNTTTDRRLNCRERRSIDGRRVSDGAWPYVLTVNRYNWLWNTQLAFTCAAHASSRTNVCITKMTTTITGVDHDGCECGQQEWIYSKRSSCSCRKVRQRGNQNSNLLQEISLRYGDGMDELHREPSCTYYSLSDRVPICHLTYRVQHEILRVSQYSRHIVNLSI